MNKMMRRVAVVPTMAAMFVFAPSTASLGDVVINNVLSPFTAIQVGPGYGRVYGYDYYGGPGRYSYYGEYGYYREQAYPTYYEWPHHSYYERPAHRRSRHHRGYSWHGYCWVVTDQDRSYGYWGRC
jgi:hypothetical protein